MNAASILRSKTVAIVSASVLGAGLVGGVAFAATPIPSDTTSMTAPSTNTADAMNDDKAMHGERIASTSNRNFEGRQGKGAKTHLMGPAMAAAAAVTGRLTDVRQLG